jgi:hypothetical protein
MPAKPYITTTKIPMSVTIAGDLSGKLLTHQQRVAAIRENIANPGVRAVLQMLEDEAVQQQGTAQLAATVQAGLSPYHCGAAASVNNVLDAVAAAIKDPD